ncbi:peptidoglycan D,D-transpeptidase FtsI family protein [Eshraghiella crossota]|uniref:peptidoglycan D,D-transpeptidase FtsI family protein n=1 Tax=Eshraghiella crossota TaxID=45851 RepID=UPI003AB2FBFE
MKKKLENRKNNKSIIVSTLIFVITFIAMAGYLIYFNLTQAESIINNSYNKRQGVLSHRTIRGSILSDDKTKLAVTNVDDDGNETRYYPYSGLFSHTIGYLNNGGYGLESLYGYYMLHSNQNFFEQIGNDLSGNRNTGDNVVTTLNVGLQKACYDALGSNRGAVIVMEPSTGKILAMVSKPDFDPNTLAANWSQITGEGSDSVLVNRATQGLYPPGSTFKLITMLEYLREHKNDYGQYHYICDGTYELGNNTINCVRTTAHGDVDLFSSLAVSCNCSFINIGLSLDLDRYKKTAEKMLFNKELPTNLEYNKSRFVLNGESSEWDIAQTSFGQGKTVITPFHLALITCTIANNGTLMEPYLVSSVESTNGMTVKKFKEEKYDTLITEKEASLLKKGMEQVVKDSFSWLFGGVEYTLAAKSGSAQYGTEGYEHSLYASFSPADNPEIAVVAVVEGGPQRNTTAAEVTKQIYDYYYSNK